VVVAAGAGALPAGPVPEFLSDSGHRTVRKAPALAARTGLAGSRSARVAPPEPVRLPGLGGGRSVVTRLHGPGDDLHQTNRGLRQDLAAGRTRPAHRPDLRLAGELRSRPLHGPPHGRPGPALDRRPGPGFSAVHAARPQRPTARPDQLARRDPGPRQE